MTLPLDTNAGQSAEAKLSIEPRWPIALAVVGLVVARAVNVFS